jgi:MFS family permease
MYTYTSEIIGGKLRVLFQPFSFVFYGLGGVFVNLIALRFSDYRFFMGMSICFVFIFSLPYFYFIETPFYYYQQKNIKALYNSLVLMCHRNFPKEEVPEVKVKLQKMLRYGRFFETDYEILNQESVENENLKDNELEAKLLEQKESEDGKNTSSIRELFRPHNLKKFIRIFTVFLMVQFIFTMSLIINKDLGIKSIYLSGVLVNLFQMLGYFVGGIVATRFGRKTILMWCCIIITLLSSTLTGIDIISNIHINYDDRSNVIRWIETSKTY